MEPASSGAARADLSGFAQVVTRLQALQSSDPTQIRVALGEMATRLALQADQVGGSAGARIRMMASRFQSAAQSGQLSGIAEDAQSAGPGAPARGTGLAARAQAAYAAQQEAGDGLVLVGVVTDALERVTRSAVRAIA
jgi:hypothetical protein